MNRKLRYDFIHATFNDYPYLYAKINPNDNYSQNKRVNNTVKHYRIAALTHCRIKNIHSFKIHPFTH